MVEERGERVPELVQADRLEMVDALDDCREEFDSIVRQGGEIGYSIAKYDDRGRRNADWDWGARV
jgi:hypothetical protein